MADEIIEYRSNAYDVFRFHGTIETKTNKGITCGWNCLINGNSKKFSWDFNWDELKKKGVEELSGYIILKRQELPEIYDIRFDVNLTNTNHFVEKVVKDIPALLNHEPFFTYRLMLHRQLEVEKDDIPYDVMFSPSELTNAILVVDGKKLHVNKAFLSFHSEYFRALFTSNFKEEKMNEIPIGDVSYEDFACLLSIIYPQNLFPDDNNVEKLLELADRFIMPCIIRTVEHHLLNISTLSNEKLICLADKYNMPALLKKTIRRLDCVEKVKHLRESPEAKNLSDKTKLALYERIMKLI